MQLPNSTNKYACDFDIAEDKFIIAGTINSNPNSRKIFVAKAYYTFGALGNTTFKKSSVSIFPNPVQNVLNISTIKDGLHQIAIYDIQGRLIHSVSLNDEHYQLDASSLTAGTYFLKVTTDQGISNKKFLKN